MEHRVFHEDPQLSCGFRTDGNPHLRFAVFIEDFPVLVCDPLNNPRFHHHPVIDYRRCQKRCVQGRYGGSLIKSGGQFSHSKIILRNKKRTHANGKIKGNGSIKKEFFSRFRHHVPTQIVYAQFPEYRVNGGRKGFFKTDGGRIFALSVF